ncbi:flavin reductase [Arthrobacter sp. LS16]|uniref:flavin reductase n=1 Tax=Arthrobacter sp. 'calajunan' TaxID=1690248 RepID=UPI003C7223BD
MITADAGQSPVALTASSVASVSGQPQLLLFSISELSSAAGGGLAQAASVVVHFLDAQDIEGTKLGATSGIDRFAQAQT